MNKKVSFSDNVDVIYYDSDKPIKQSYNFYILGFFGFLLLFLCLL